MSDSKKDCYEREQEKKEYKDERKKLIAAVTNEELREELDRRENPYKLT